MTDPDAGSRLEQLALRPAGRRAEWAGGAAKKRAMREHHRQVVAGAYARL